MWQNIADIISTLLILGAFIVFFIFALWDNADCYDCGSRDGALCWLVALLLFFALLIPLLLLWLTLCLSSFRKKKIRRVIEEDNYYYDEQE